ncbi:hypothetical protein SLA2020_275880 [Shorea laevis]
MSERAHAKRSKSTSPPPLSSSNAFQNQSQTQTVTLISAMARKSSLLKQTLATILIILVVYALLNTFLSPANSFSSISSKTTLPFNYANSASINEFSLENMQNSPENQLRV